MEGTMADTRYLKKRGQVWCFQMGVPRPLRKQMKRKTIVKALHTQSLSEAQKRRWPLVEEWRTRFERAATNVPMAPTEIDRAAHQVYDDMLRGMDKWAKLHPAPLMEDKEGLDVAIDYLRDEICRGYETEIWEGSIDLDGCIEAMSDFPMVAQDMEAVLSRTGVAVERSSWGAPASRPGDAAADRTRAAGGTGQPDAPGRDHVQRSGRTVPLQAAA
jgi:hypothetical protein